MHIYLHRKAVNGGGQNYNAEIYLHLQEKSTRRNCQKKCKLSNPQNAYHGYLRSNFISKAFVIWSRLHFCCFGAIFPSVSVMIPTYPPFFRSNSHFLFHKNYKWKFAFFCRNFCSCYNFAFFSTPLFPALSLPSQTPGAALHTCTASQCNIIGTRSHFCHRFRSGTQILA